MANGEHQMRTKQSKLVTSQDSKHAHEAAIPLGVEPAGPAAAAAAVVMCVCVCMLKV
jgi:hypothetical protein